jgi:hypothetical protein
LDLKEGRGVTRREGDEAWRVQHDKHGKFQYLFLVLVILQFNLNFRDGEKSNPTAW